MIDNAVKQAEDSLDLSPDAVAGYIFDLTRDLVDLAREARLSQLAAALDRANSLAAEAAVTQSRRKAASDDAA